MIIVITGPIKIGKSTLLYKLYQSLKNEFSIGGLITLGQENRTFVNLLTEERRDFREYKDTEGISIGKYFISKQSIDFANQAIKESSKSEIIIIDEIGRLECEKKCLYDEISNFLANPIIDDKFIILCIRDIALPHITAILNIKIDDIWKITSQPNQDLYNHLVRLIRESISRGREDSKL